MGAFIEADIGKLEGVITKGQEIITEFNKIKSDFETINSTLLSTGKVTVLMPISMKQIISWKTL